MFETGLENSKNEFLNQLRHLCVSGFEDRPLSKYLKMGQQVFEKPGVVDRIIFPVDAIVSIEYCVDENACTDLLTVGREGFVGVSRVAGSALMLGHAVVRQQGEVLEMNLKTFTKMLQQSKAAKHLCDRYVLYRMACLAQRTACRMNHTVLQRLCQKLLVWEDRNGGRGHFSLTHKNLANMLGIHRATTSEHLTRLQSLGVVTYSHGQVVICNREQLLKKSCGCFRITRDLYRNLVEESHLRSYVQGW